MNRFMLNGYLTVTSGLHKIQNPPARRCQPRPMILPPFTSTAPTIGFGEVMPQPSGRARRMNWASDIADSVAADGKRLKRKG